jgi:hypothetical protein
MISARLKSKQPADKPIAMLALTLEDRNALRALMAKVLESIEGDKKGFTVVSGPRRGRLIRDDEDITQLTFELDRWARAFLRRL